MKKIQKLLLLLMIGVLPTLAKASQIGFDAVVTNENGLKYCENEKLTKNCKKVEKGTTIEVIKMDKKDVYNGFIDDEIYFIESKGFKPVEDTVRYDYSTVADRYDSEDYIIGNNVITRKETVLRKGPDKTFSTITTIPAGTELSFRYYDYEDDYTAIPTHIFVNYNGQEGWVDCSDEKVFFYDVGFVYSNFEEVKTANYTIPKFSYAAVKGYTSNYRYIQYEEDEIAIDYINDEIWQAVKPSIAIAKKNITVYSDRNKTKVVKTINPGDEVTLITGTDAESFKLHLVDVDGVKGLISFNSYADESVFEHTIDDVDYEAIGLGKYLDFFVYTSVEEPVNNKEEVKIEEKKDDNKTSTIIIISSIVFALIMGAIFFIIKK